jgi:nicotinate-nucleotide pyrophosphorylase (carboxylating)
MDPAELIRVALAEDVGDGDVTTAITVPEGARGRARIVQKAPGVLFGLDLAELAFRTVDADVQLERRADEGVWREDGEVLEIEGTVAGILTAERTALNVLARLSGVATATAKAVREVEGTKTRILDTRKTTPGMRLLEKAAVRAGGGVNHRIGLFDAVLIKENHAAAAGGVGAAVRRALAERPDLLVEAECRDRAEVDEALEAGAPRLLLDNMTPDELAAIVEHVGGRAELEASGGITVADLRAVARTGVDFVSLGALTHSAPALDLSLLLDP